MDATNDRARVVPGKRRGIWWVEEPPRVIRKAPGDPLGQRDPLRFARHMAHRLAAPVLFGRLDPVTA